jgi:dTDP-glucose 4,6-dehydratase
MRILVTGGAGFIGSNLVRYILRERENTLVRVLDKLTYAGNLENLAELSDDPRFEFMQGDICDSETARVAVEGVDVVAHLAAESHVDRSIISAEASVQTNFVGTFRMLEAAREVGVGRFLHMSTDEVYGSTLVGRFAEDSPLNPRNPYSASKAGADRLAYSYFVTHDLPVVIARPANNYGPHQYPEKLIPFFVYRAMRGEHLPVYGDGMQMRDWLFVEDDCRALLTIIERGEPGEAYNVEAGNERPNLEVIRLILDELGESEDLIRHVEDRPGHDLRYSMDGSKLRGLGWTPEMPWEDGIRLTVRWLAEHEEWMERAVARSRDYFEQWYAGR